MFFPTVNLKIKNVAHLFCFCDNDICHSYKIQLNALLLTRYIRTLLMSCLISSIMCSTSFGLDMDILERKSSIRIRLNYTRKKGLLFIDYICACIDRMNVVYMENCIIFSVERINF